MKMRDNSKVIASGTSEAVEQAEEKKELTN